MTINDAIQDAAGRGHAKMEPVPDAYVPMVRCARCGARLVDDGPRGLTGWATTYSCDEVFSVTNGAL